MRFTSGHIQHGLAHLRANDRRLARLIELAGPFRLTRQKDRFWMLVRSIVGQQISTGAARAIAARLKQTFPPGRVDAQQLLQLPQARLQVAGLSAQKIIYLRDLAGRIAAGELQLDRIGRLEDEAVIARLTEVKGIGRWTAQMFLIFSLGRLDVFPEDDLGIRTALQRLHSLPELPAPSLCRTLAAPWRPYATLGSWYCWRSLDLARSQSPPAFGQPGYWG